MASIKRSPLLGSLALLLLPVVSCSCPPTPSVSSLSPSSATAGGGGFSLTVNGNDFSSNAVVVWDGTAQATSFVSSKQLTASISPTNIAQAGTAEVYVYNPASTGETISTGTIQATNNTQCGSPGSNEVSFTVSP